MEKRLYETEAKLIVPVTILGVKQNQYPLVINLEVKSVSLGVCEVITDNNTDVEQLHIELDKYLSKVFTTTKDVLPEIETLRELGFKICYNRGVIADLMGMLRKEHPFTAGIEYDPYIPPKLDGRKEIILGKPIITFEEICIGRESVRNYVFNVLSKVQKQKS